MIEIITVSLIAIFFNRRRLLHDCCCNWYYPIAGYLYQTARRIKSSTLGVGLTLIGVFIYFAYYHAEVDTQLLLAVIFIFISAPVGAHLIARSAFHSDVEPYQLTILNELKRDETGSEVETEETARLKIERSKNKELDD